GGLDVFPRLVAGGHLQGPKRGLLKSDNAELEALRGGGPQHGTGPALRGPAGSGKATLAIQFARAGAGRGERAVVFAFDERVETILERTEGLGMDLSKFIEWGPITIHPIDT